jgi:2'-5' RNA ligase
VLCHADRVGEEQSGLVVTVPDLEPVVGPWRRELDQAASWGVPAHVTVLFPFLPPTEIDAAVSARLAAAAAGVPAFAVSFARTDWFDRDVVWLAPEPDDGFRALTAAVMSAFPGVLPYGGEFGATPTPHLTLGAEAAPERLAAAERAVGTALPVRVAVGELTLLTGAFAPPGWSVRERFALG